MHVGFAEPNKIHRVPCVVRLLLVVIVDWGIGVCVCDLLQVFRCAQPPNSNVQFCSVLFPTPMVSLGSQKPVFLSA